MNFSRINLFVLLLVSLRSFAGDAPLPVEVPPTEAKLQYSGRFDTRDPKGPRCAWSACAVTMKFKGTAVNARLGEQGTDRVQVVIDGKPVKVLAPKGADDVYSLAVDL